MCGKAWSIGSLARVISTLNRRSTFPKAVIRRAEGVLYQGDRDRHFEGLHRQSCKVLLAPPVQRGRRTLWAVQGADWCATLATSASAVFLRGPSC